jgi:drug/metabolite transporter (DMT)-like permease
MTDPDRIVRAAPWPHAARTVAALMSATVLLDCAVQVLWKHVALSLPVDITSPSAMTAQAMRPATWGLVALFMLQWLCWTRLLRHVDLSFAQPITSLSYPGVALLSVLLLGESFGWRQAVGIALILGGVWLISHTPSRTAQAST